jgi:hypothetical protein
MASVPTDEVDKVAFFGHLRVNIHLDTGARNLPTYQTIRSLYPMQQDCLPGRKTYHQKENPTSRLFSMRLLRETVRSFKLRIC